MKKFIIWDKISILNNCEPEIWFQEYPRSKQDTLVLINENYVYFLEDIKVQGFTGATDEQIVEKFLIHLEEEELKRKQQQLEEEQKQKEQEEQEQTEIDKLKETINSLEKRQKSMRTLIDTIILDNVGGVDNNGEEEDLGIDI